MADTTEVEVSAKFRAYRNGKAVVDMPFTMSASSYLEHATDRVILATNMTSPQEYNMGGVGTGKFLMVETDRPILMSLDTTVTQWNVGRGTQGGVVVFIGSFTHVYFQNTNTTNTVTANVAVSDEV
jgi:hypothetical protein